MPVHVVVGANHSATAAARLLVESGDRVRVLSRRGGGPEHPLIERIAADANDAALLTELTQAAVTFINCASPAYNMLPTTIYGRVRMQMWQDGITAHEEGRIRLAEVRPGDFIGPGAEGQSCEPPRAPSPSRPIDVCPI